MIAFSRVRLPDELMHLRVRRHVHDEIDLRVLDAVDSPGECRVVAGQVLQERRERVAHPGIGPLVDAEDLVAVAREPQSEVRTDLARRAGDEDTHPEESNGAL
jgi:hypothetical protein